jgi:hypothetical protein
LGKLGLISPERSNANRVYRPSSPRRPVPAKDRGLCSASNSEFDKQK